MCCGCLELTVPRRPSQPTVNISALKLPFKNQWSNVAFSLVTKRLVIDKNTRVVYITFALANTCLDYTEGHKEEKVHPQSTVDTLEILYPKMDPWIHGLLNHTRYPGY